MKRPEDISRRALLRSATLGLGVVAGVIACKKSLPVFVCVNDVPLSPEDVLARKKLAYVDRTSDPRKTCGDCQQYVPAPTDDRCGGCKIVRGPIHPAGYCKAYTPRA